MTPGIDAGTRTRGALLLADISGYTSFLQGVADAHYAIIVEADEPPAAYALVSSLLDRIVTELEPAFRLAKFEGDAVFAVAPDVDGSVRGPAVLDRIRACHAGFVEGLAEADRTWSCTCDACSRVSGLGLKFILHHGNFVTQRIAGREELAGADVIVAHRLLKNHAGDLVGARPYALVTDAALLSLGVPPDGMLEITEAYDGIPPIPAHVLPLG